MQASGLLLCKSFIGAAPSDVIVLPPSCDYARASNSHLALDGTVRDAS